MRPVKIAGAEPKPLGAPADWNEDDSGPCSGLFIRRENIGGVDYMRSAWEIEHGEAAMFYAGAKLTLGVAGQCHPVVQLNIDPLPEDFEPVIHVRKFNAPNGESWVRVEMLMPAKGGVSAYAEIKITSNLARAVAKGITVIERLAKEKGWLPA